MGFDALFMEFVHSLCVNFGGFMTPLLRIVSLLGEKAWFFLLISFILLLNKKTRWIGATAILSIFIGWIIADYGIKPLIMRMRPYTANNTYQDYWVMAGSYPETDYSMPSGHVLGCAAFFISLYISCRREMRQRISFIGIICVFLMILSRTYFMHHYFSDCIFGVLIAVFTSYLSKFIIKKIYMFIKKNENNELCNFILNFDIAKSLNNKL